MTPIRNKAPPPELRFPLNFRVVMRVWNWLFFQPGIIMPDQAKGTEWNRGRYLVEALGHCGACHTPKNFFGADKRGQAFAGGRVDGMFAPRLDGAERSGLKSWSAEDITEYLQSGRNAEEPCRQADVRGRRQFDLEDERRRYPRHRGLPEVPARRPAEPVVTPPVAGADGRRREGLRSACIACHEADGSSAPRIYPPLPGNANLQSADPLSTMRIILDGARDRDDAARAQQGIDAGLCRSSPTRRSPT